MANTFSWHLPLEVRIFVFPDYTASKEWLIFHANSSFLRIRSENVLERSGLGVGVFRANAAPTLSKLGRGFYAALDFSGLKPGLVLLRCKTSGARGGMKEKRNHFFNLFPSNEKHTGRNVNPLYRSVMSGIWRSFFQPLVRTEAILSSTIQAITINHMNECNGSCSLPFSAPQRSSTPQATTIKPCE